MSGKRQALGKHGEGLAVRHLQDAGLTILERNYRCPLGEMDIIAREKDVLVFIEVRTRATGRQGWGEESITSHKRARLNRIAMHYLKFYSHKEWPPMRFDLIAIRSKDEGEIAPEICWIRGI